ncbi:MAG: VIT1/CCC1 transporter family protein [Solirubrobacterales bacterium]
MSRSPRQPGEQHTGANSANALRAAVLGANDGLVSVLSLVMGVAGGGLSTNDIFVAGVAGLLAGACSMAMGEWVSVTSARELFQLQLDEERAELREQPEEERLELIEIFENKGIEHHTAVDAADNVLANPEHALDTMAREELGIDPDELGGSPYQAAAASFGLFIVGALPPVLPFAFGLDRRSAIVLSLTLSAVMLFVIGAAITRLTGRPWVMSGLRQLAIGLAAAAVTYGIGSLLNVAVS